MRNALNIFLLTLGVTLFYNYVGQLVPQKENHPPKEVSVGDNMSSAEMVAAGKELFEGKGTCRGCHNGSARFPDLEKEQMGAVAGSRRAGMSDIEYLAESIYLPNDFIVPPFGTGMVVPATLTDKEILCLVAYLQSLGGTPSVTMQTKLKWQGQRGDGGAAGGAPAAVPMAGAGNAGKTGEQLATETGCVGCHSLAAPIRLLGPSLVDVGKRLSVEQIYEAVMEPEKTIAVGDPPYPPVMGATLTANGFYDKMSATDIKKMVEYLSSLKGAG